MLFTNRFIIFDDLIYGKKYVAKVENIEMLMIYYQFLLNAHFSPWLCHGFNSRAAEIVWCRLKINLDSTTLEHVRFFHTSSVSNLDHHTIEY